MTDYTGRFVWYDLFVDDVEAAKAFYTETIGWKTMPWQGEGDYTMWANGEAPIGGVMKLPEGAKKMGAPNHWMAYIGHPDVDALSLKVVELGGKVLSPAKDIPEVGRFVVCADPAGAAFAAFTSLKASEHGGEAPKPGEFSWHELITTDYEGAMTFYGALFGWQPGESVDANGIKYQMYTLGGMPLGGMFNKTDDMPGPPAFLYYIHVESLDDAIGRATNLGAKLLNGPMKVPGGSRIAQLLDNQGVAFALHGACRDV